jgi:hypothetical protein
MTDPGLWHAVCPECHEHRPLTVDGYFVHHRPSGNSEWCPGSGDYPNRVVSGRYSSGSSFESCPAATGEARPACADFPDGAHRCGEQRGHVTGASPEHHCTCGATWFSQMGTLAELVELMNREPN